MSGRLNILLIKRPFQPSSFLTSETKLLAYPVPTPLSKPLKPLSPFFLISKIALEFL